MPRGSFVDGAVAVLAGFGAAWFCVTCGVTPMARRLATWSAVLYALSSPAVMRRPAALRLAFSMVSEALRSAVPLACVTLPATANPCRFSMVALPI
jgi:hypothetical protein